MSLIRQFIDHIYGKRNKYNITFLGLDAGGKTTLLYLLRLNEVITTIPTFGFNVEAFSPPTLTKDGGIKNASHEIVGWDGGSCAGPRYKVGLLLPYIDMADALVWVIDSCDPGRLQDSAEEMARTLRIFRQWKYGQEDGSKEVSVKPKQKPILVLANKQDLPNPMTVDEIRKACANVLSGTICAVYPTTAMAGLSAKSGLPQAFDWLHLAVEISRERSTDDPMQQGPKEGTKDEAKEKTDSHQTSIRTPGNLASGLNFWLARLENDPLTPGVFLQKFNDVALPDWDHYTHIRLAYHILRMYGRQKGKDMIFNGIENYILKSKGSQTAGKTFHITMTYFWIQIVDFSIQNTSRDFTPNVDADDSRAWVDDFARFLIINPFIVDGSLWMDYYSKEAIMNPIAKKQMVLPDKKPLPSIAARDFVAKLATTPSSLGDSAATR